LTGADKWFMLRERYKPLSAPFLRLKGIKMKYILVTATSPKGLSEAVQNGLDKGWELYKAPGVGMSGNRFGDRTRYIQAMIKKETK